MTRMPKPFFYLLVLGVMLTAVLPLSVGQEKPRVIRLKVFYDGQEKPVPDQIIMKPSFNKPSVTIPIHNGEFELPPDLDPMAIVFSFDLIDENIKFPLFTTMLDDVKSLSVYLGEQQFKKFKLPEEVNIKESCIVELTKSKSWLIIPINQCRSKPK